METMNLATAFYFGGNKPPRPPSTLSAPPPQDWCFECMRAMREAGAVYVCEGCGNCQFNPEAAS